MADIFLSYKKEDRDLAESIIGQLESSGFSVWYDERLNPLQSWDATIEAEIARASAVVVLWTRRSVKSEWVRNEADYGKDHGKLIPLLLEDCEIPLAFRRVQAAILTDWNGDIEAREWRKACDWIQDRIHNAANSQRKVESAERSQPSPRSTGVAETSTVKRSTRKVSWLLAAAVLMTSVIGVVFMLSQNGKPTVEHTSQLDPRQQRAKTLYEQAYFLTPHNIGVRMHLESDRSRLCISSNFEPNQWENLFRSVNANPQFKRWSLGFDLTIATENLMSGDCLILAVSKENLQSVEQLGQMLEVQQGKQYRLVPMTDMYEPWELGL